MDTYTSNQKETVKISSKHNEEGQFREFNTHRKMGNIEQAT